MFARLLALGMIVVGVVVAGLADTHHLFTGQAAGITRVDSHEHSAAPARYRLALPVTRPPEVGVHLGVFEPGAPLDMRKIDEYSARVGRPPAIIMDFVAWRDRRMLLNDKQLNDIIARGSVPLITWEPWDPGKGTWQSDYSLATINSGRYDDYIRQNAQIVGRQRGTVLIRLAHEMNLDRYPWAGRVNGNSPAEYVRMWSRIHGIFRDAGVRNVQWVWSPGLTWLPENAIEPYFPGDDVVDWVGTSGYNNPPWGGWKPFRETFGPTLRGLQAVSARPLIVAEVGSSEVGGSKADWILETYRTAPSEFPRLQAIVWFNVRETEVDWRIHSSESSRQAFRQAISSPVYFTRWLGIR